jgi:hypothetical protein
LMPVWLRHGMGYLAGALACRPSFVAYAIADLPALAPSLARNALQLPLLAWVVRTEADRQHAASVADQMIFEDFRP